MTSLTSSPELTPRAAIVVGAIFIVMGVGLMLGALEILPLHVTPGTPAWVGVSAGMVFALGGLAVINGYVFGGQKPGSMILQRILAFGICAGFAAIGGWIAFGAGTRAFSTTSRLPGYSMSGAGREWMGRAVFGIGAVMAAAMAVAMVFAGRKR